MFVSIYVSMSFIAIVATPFNPQLRNFGTTFLMWLSKNGFLKFLKNCFFPELLPFFYISLRFLCKFEERLYPVTLLLPALSRLAREPRARRRYFKHEPAWRYVQARIAEIAYVIDWMPYWAKLETNKNMYKTSLNKNFDTAIIQIRKK